jgi:hypothetical protein
VGGDATNKAFGNIGGSGNLPGGGYHTWALVDIDGDGRPDLVRTLNVGDVSVGDARWLVYGNTGTAFAAGSDFALPAVGGDATNKAFASIAGSGNLPGGGYHSWGTLDLDGDRRPDLVRTLDVGDDAVGNARWLVYPNAGAGFGAEAAFALPDVGGDATHHAFANIAGSGNLPAGGYHTWATLDLDGDGLLDLVRTLVVGDPTVGNARWLVYSGACRE